MNDDDQDLVGQRLRSAIHEHARRHPLPGDFVFSVAGALPDRASDHLRWRPVFSAIGTFALVAVLVAALASRDAVPGLDNTPSAGAGHTDVSLTPGGANLTHYAGEGFSLEYPADWRVIAENLLVRHYEWIPLVLGTGDWAVPCQTTEPSRGSGSSVHCGADAYSVADAQIVVKLSALQGPSPIAESPPVSAITLQSGLLAAVQDTPTMSTWRLYLPGWSHPLTIQAQLGPDQVEASREAVRLVAESVRIVP